MAFKYTIQDGQQTMDISMGTAKITSPFPKEALDNATKVMVDIDQVEQLLVQINNEPKLLVEAKKPKPRILLEEDFSTITIINKANERFVDIYLDITSACSWQRIVDWAAVHFKFRKEECWIESDGIRRNGDENAFDDGLEHGDTLNLHRKR